MKEINEWMVDWLNLFPDNLQSITGYNVRSKPKDCINKMVKFMKEYPQYNKDIIFEATKNYLKHQENKGWEYTKQACYFISKLGQPSVLEQYCSKVINKDIELIVADPYNPINDFI